MRIIITGAAAALFSIATASPAFAHFGGSPTQQVKNGLYQPDQVQDDDDDDQAYAFDDGDGYDKPGADDDQGAYADQDDVDYDVDQGDVYDDGDQAQTWQGEDGRAYCRRSDGTTGLVVGGGAGALIGRGIDGGRHRGAGTIIGAIAGALIGTAIEQSANQQNCR